MARMSKRISSNATKVRQANAPAPKKKPGKDYWIIALIIINGLLILTSWTLISKEPFSFATSVVLEAILVIMYSRRHYEFKEQTEKWLAWTQYACMAIIIMLFLYTTVINYIIH